jgi:hypothetical protein
LLERDDDGRAGKEDKSRDRGIEITFESRSWGSDCGGSSSFFSNPSSWPLHWSFVAAREVVALHAGRASTVGTTTASVLARPAFATQSCLGTILALFLFALIVMITDFFWWPENEWKFMWFCWQFAAVFCLSLLKLRFRFANTVHNFFHLFVVFVAHEGKLFSASPFRRPNNGLRPDFRETVFDLIVLTFFAFTTVPASHAS